MNEDPSEWRRATPAGIKYRLLENGPGGSFEESKGDITEDWLIQAVDLNNLIAEVLPGWTAGTYDTGLAYGPIPALWARRLAFKPFTQGLPADPWSVDAGAPDGTYQPFLHVTVTFSTPDDNGGGNDPENPEILAVDCNGSGEFLVHPTTKCTWDGAGNTKQPDIPLTKMVPSIEWRYRFQRMPRSSLLVLLNVARPLLGCVNSGPVTSLMSSDAGTVIFLGWSFATRWTWKDTEPYAEVELNFNEKRINDGGIKGHNHFYDPDDGEWKRILRPNGRYAYEEADLSVIF